MKILTWEMTADVSGPLPDDFNDWPAQMQDAVYKRMEALSALHELPLAIAASECRKDHDHVGDTPRYYVHVILSEVVAADSRGVSQAQAFAEMPDEIRRLLN